MKTASVESCSAEVLTPALSILGEVRVSLFNSTIEVHNAAIDKTMSSSTGHLETTWNNALNPTALHGPEALISHN